LARLSDARSRVLGLLSDCKPRAFNEIVKETGLGKKAVECLLYRLWRDRVVLRTEKPLMRAQRIFKGRGGASHNLRKYYLYILKPEDKDSVEFQGMRFVKYNKGIEKPSKESKANILYQFLERNKESTFFSKEIAEALKDRGIKPSDVMTNIRKLERKENYIRVASGRRNRIGHNWEACVEWFIDKFTTGAQFMTQDHRNKIMDKRRITLHLIKSVSGRLGKAEVDRVWTVTPSIFAQSITYVLECKWGLVSKRDVDDFLEVLKWSSEFGVNTPEGRQVKQGVIGVFAGSAFNPKEKVKLKDETIVNLPTYVARMNIQLLKASDFNEKLKERGCTKATVQKICKLAKDENEVREVLEKLWESPQKDAEILNEVASKNREVYEFEKEPEGNK
jgi:hypothetical protein